MPISKRTQKQYACDICGRANKWGEPPRGKFRLAEYIGSNGYLFYTLI